jgi:hypothetical protein
MIVFLHGGNFLSDNSAGLKGFFRALGDSRPGVAFPTTR